MPKSLPNRFRFTDLALARLKPPTTGEVVCWDTLLVGLGCRVSKTGRKTWCVAIGGGKRRLGTFPELSVAAARAKARELMAGGVDTSPKSRRGFHTLVEEFLQHGRTRKGRELRQNTLGQYRRNLTRYAKPLWFRGILQIQRRDIAELLRRVATESGATTASLLRSMLHRLFEFSIEIGEREDNPVAHTPGYEVGTRSRVLSDGEIAALWRLLGAEEFHMIIRLLLWTGCRRSEAGGLRWSELGMDHLTYTTWTVPGARTKNGRELRLPLPRQTADMISRFPRVLGRDCLFGVHSSRGFTSWSENKAALDKQLRFSRPWVLHDIRRSVQSRLAGLAVPHPVINRILNHAFDPVTEAYDHHSYQPEMKSALQLWADKLAEIVTNSQPGVIKLQRRKRS